MTYIRYWPQYAPEEQEKIVVVVSPDDDSGSWWPAVARLSLAAVMASGVAAADVVQAATNIPITVDDAFAIVPLSVDDNYSPARELNYVFGNCVTVFRGASDRAFATIRAEDNDPGQPEITLEPTIYVIGPGNWAAGSDDLAVATKEEEYWDNPVASRAWEIRPEKPWFIPDDPIFPRVRSDQDESLPEIGPLADPLVYIVSPWAWTAGSDEMPRVTRGREEDYWFDPSPQTQPLWEMVPLRAYGFQPEDPLSGIVTVKIVEDEFWTNPRVPFPYWNMWPAPTYQQDDPSGLLFVLPVLPCVVSPALMGIVTTSVAFTPTAFAQVVFTDVCGDPLP